MMGQFSDLHFMRPEWLWLLAPAAVLYVVLAFAKLRMPLHFDVGDKSRYQV